MAKVRVGTMGSKVGTLAALTALALGNVPAAAQGFTTEVRGGISFPAGDLAEVTDVGFNGGLGLGWVLSERLAIRADGDLEFLNEDARGGVVMPRTFLWHYQAGLELGLTGADSDWLIRARGGAGGTTYDTDRFDNGGDDFLHSAFSVSGGLGIGRRWLENAEVGVLGRGFVAFLDDERTAELAALNPTRVTNFSKSSSFPISIYIRWGGLLPN